MRPVGETPVGVVWGKNGGPAVNGRRGDRRNGGVLSVGGPRLRERGHVVALVGDGMNDSPALSHADVGISMKLGSDIAGYACDVLLLGGMLDRIVEARVISRADFPGRVSWRAAP